MTTNRRGSLASVGMCVQCGKRPSVGRMGGGVDGRAGGLFCEMHILMTAARRWLGDSKKWHELEALFREQGGICAYSGERLTIGLNASLDHKTPRSRGGGDTIGNVQWVTWTVNRAKTDMTHDEFIALCAVVAERYAPHSAALRTLGT